MTDAREELGLEEYRALRATIRERGSTRLIVTAITFIGWGAILILGWPLVSGTVIAALAPLLVLAAGFETALSAHVGAERVGRYVFVQYEGDGRLAPRWEHAVMSFSGHRPGLALDPLHGALFQCAAGVNLLPLLVRVIDSVSFPQRGAYAAVAMFQAADLAAAVVVVLAHAFFVMRVRRALQFARRQRDHDTEILRQLDKGPVRK